VFSDYIADECGLALAYCCPDNKVYEVSQELFQKLSVENFPTVIQQPCQTGVSHNPSV